MLHRAIWANERVSCRPEVAPCGVHVLQAQVIPTALHDGCLNRLLPQRLDEWDVLVRELGLEGQGVGGDDDAAVRLGACDGGYQIRESLADPGPGLNQGEASGCRQGGFYGGGGRLLLRAG